MSTSHIELFPTISMSSFWNHSKLQVAALNEIMDQEQEHKWKIKCKIESIQKAIKRLFVNNRMQMKE